MWTCKACCTSWLDLHQSNAANSRFIDIQGTLCMNLHKNARIRFHALVITDILVLPNGCNKNNELTSEALRLEVVRQGSFQDSCNPEEIIDFKHIKLSYLTYFYNTSVDYLQLITGIRTHSDYTCITFWVKFELQTIKRLCSYNHYVF